MQTSEVNQFLAKRTRYYQGLIDLNTLDKGESYKKLKESYIIFICTFDPFKQNRKIYTFRNKCIEVEGLELNDETTKIFLNSKGTEGKLNVEVDNFLKYVKSGVVEGNFITKIDERLREIKSREEVGVEYMTLELWLQDAKDDAFAEGAFTKELDNLKRLIKKMHIGIEEAMNLLDVPDEEKERYKTALENQ